MPQELNTHWLASVGALLLSAALVAAVGCSDDKSTGNGDDSRFDPVQVTIVIGDTIKWTATSGDHTATSGTGSSDPSMGDLFDLELNEGTSATHVFNDIGSFDYFCIPHEDDGMKGKVIVTAVDIDTTQVSASGTAFSPANITIEEGDAVRWTSSGSHTVTSGEDDSDPDAGLLFDATLNNGQSFVYTFNTPGVYDYFCEIHVAMGMKGRVTVTERTNHTVEVEATM
jgi:plastocyanin